MHILSSDYRDLLAKYLKPQLKSVSVLSALIFTDISLQMFNPQLLRIFLDAVTTYGPIAGIAGAFIGIALLQQLVTVIATYFSERIGWKATNALRADLALHLIRQDLAFHNQRTPGELIERVDGDVTILANFFSQFIIKMVGNILLLIGIIIVLCLQDWPIGLALAIFSLLVLIVMNRMRNIAVPYWKALRQVSANLYGFLEERIHGTEDIRASDAQGYIVNRFFTYTHERLRAGRKANLLSAIPWGLPVLFYAIGNLIAFVLAALLYRVGSITIGTAFLIYYYTQLIVQPMLSISDQFDDFQKANASIIRIRELLQIQSTLADGPGVTFPAGPLSIIFKSVTFSYKNEEIILSDISFHLKAGEVLGMLGRTGSGKTTITRLMARLYDPTAGSISLGGHELRSARLAELRKCIGIVTQDVQLFHASIRDNLTFFDRGIHDQQITQAFQDLELMPWFTTLPHGLDTMLAANGSGLSAGEAQLLALVRVFLRNPGLIILDEASSRLDPATEHLIEHAIEKLLCGRTGIIIAHRLHTLQRVDTIMIIEQGHIREYGSRTALSNDPYSRFATLLRTAHEDLFV